MKNFLTKAFSTVLQKDMKANVEEDSVRLGSPALHLPSRMNHFATLRAGRGFRPYKPSKRPKEMAAFISQAEWAHWVKRANTVVQRDKDGFSRRDYKVSRRAIYLENCKLPQPIEHMHSHARQMAHLKAATACPQLNKE